MKHSVALRMSATNSVLKGWYKNRPLQEIINVNFKVERILKNELRDLTYFRVNIPKGDPKEIIKFFAATPSAV